MHHRRVYPTYASMIEGRPRKIRRPRNSYCSKNLHLLQHPRDTHKRFMMEKVSSGLIQQNLDCLARTPAVQLLNQGKEELIPQKVWDDLLDQAFVAIELCTDLFVSESV
jgi:hypothetical protein